MPFTECKATRANPRHIQNLAEMIDGNTHFSESFLFNAFRRFFRENHFLSGFAFVVQFRNGVFVHPSHSSAHKSQSIDYSMRTMQSTPKLCLPSITQRFGRVSCLFNNSIASMRQSWSTVERGAVRRKIASKDSAICFGSVISFVF